MDGSPHRFEPSRGFWVLIGAALLLNLSFDYYHPLGIVFDVVIGVVLLIAYIGKTR